MNLVKPICITKVTLTEYGGKKKVIDLSNQELLLKKQAPIKIEDELCQLFSDNNFIATHATWISRECTMEDIVRFNEHKHDGPITSRRLSKSTFG